MVKCPECGSEQVYRDPKSGEYVCKKCHVILSEDQIDMGKDWRSFDNSDKQDNVGTGSPMKFTKINKGLETMIERSGRDLRGNKLSTKSRAQMYRLIKWHKRSSISNSMQRNLSIALTELRRIASYLNIPNSLVETAALLYRKTVEKGLIRGRLIEAVVAAVLYSVCRTYNVPRTLNEMAEASGLTKKEIGRTYRFIVKELDISVPLTDPSYYISRFVSVLNLSAEVEAKGKLIVKKAIASGLISGRGPTGVAAAAVYIAALMVGERRTQKEVANVAGVTEVTIRNRYRELKSKLKLKVDA
ncbi:MAG: transcription initiation factor IIB [archaeon]|jgi:transcription initiation factor TFIIB|nr:transcription initiation factor IIB [archaeon]MDD2478089.1 transcription initiation factor IIB [Candidatus ainarchaeum sp.]MDD3084937.1 transcription initiation factor IIB [Candidatus ainarchaeum sp.]MDD4221469.1 transcription initiation factor IIB [Candidatus ainarchaeum sp.]MDD4662999.1 transcription initiation factor IIB [Candidatus ainarchaeum sp.]